MCRARRGAQGKMRLVGAAGQAGPSPPPGLTLVPRDGWRPLPKLCRRGGVWAGTDALRTFPQQVPGDATRRMSKRVTSPPQFGGEAGREGPPAGAVRCLPEPDRPAGALSPARPFARSSRRLATPPPNCGGGVARWPGATRSERSRNQAPGGRDPPYVEPRHLSPRSLGERPGERARWRAQLGFCRCGKDRPACRTHLRSRFNPR
jgi:hypothetical protein